jgi:hypothetical protein
MKTDKNTLYKTMPFCETQKSKFPSTKRYCPKTTIGETASSGGGKRVVLEGDELCGGCQRGCLLPSTEINGTLFRRFRLSCSTTQPCHWTLTKQIPAVPISRNRRINYRQFLSAEIEVCLEDDHGRLPR